MRGSSGRPGSRTASEPAAMMHCSKRMRSVPLARMTSMTFGLTKLPVPRTTSTLRCRASASSPPVSFATTPAFHARSLARSMRGSPKAMPCSLIACGVLDDLGGMQQCLGGNAADVQAHATERLASARPASPSGPGRRRGTRRCSRPARSRAPAAACCGRTAARAAGRASGACRAAARGHRRRGSRGGFGCGAAGGVAGAGAARCGRPRLPRRRMPAAQ